MPKGMSLHVGLNTVDEDHYGTDGRLAGCENDARDMRAIAKDCGFETKILLTKEAKAEKFLREIENAAEQLRAGDTFMLTLACHGSQIPNAESDTDDDESDDMDETWLLYDRMIVDDEAHAAFEKFAPGVRIVVISDSCHSGTAVRLLLSLKEKGDVSRSLGLSKAFKPRCIPYRQLKGYYRENKEFYESVQLRGRGSRGKGGATVLLISGCQDNQTSGDGVQNGFFTEHLKTVWNNGNFKGSYERFHKAIVKSMDTPLQVPNLYVYGPEADKFRNAAPFSLSGRQHQPNGDNGHDWRNGNGAESGRFTVYVPSDKIELALRSPDKWEAFVDKACKAAIVEAGKALADVMQNQRQLKLRGGARGEAHVGCSVDKGGVKCEGGVSWKF